jgi:hypothetical protein
LGVTFETLVHRRIYEKVGCYLMEIGLPTVASESGMPRYIVEHGSARVSVSVVAAGDNNAIVMVSSLVVRGTNPDDPELQTFLLQANENLLFGGFGMDAEGSVGLYHALLGTSCTRAALRPVLFTIANKADEYDDVITSRFGGVRALDAPPPEAVVPR